MSMLIERLAIIGVGLIGGSLALALRQAGVVGEIVGGGRSQRSLQRAQSLGVIDRYEVDLLQAVQGADMVVLAMPVGAIAASYAQLLPGLSADAVVTDVGSTKASVLQAIAAQLGQVPANFVAAHPVAGTEKSGAAAAFPALFRNRRVIVTPTADTLSPAVARVEAMWQACGARVSQMQPEHHDTVLAATSHLPHLLAFALVDCLAGMDDGQEIFTYAAGGFRDFTRIAASHPQMWADICTANASALLAVLDRYEHTLTELRQAIGSADHAQLVASFERARQAREHFAGQMGNLQQLDGAME